MNGTPWTRREITYLRRHYRTKPAWQIAEHLGRSTRSVQNKANQLGLKKLRPRRPAADVIAAVTKHHPQGLSDAEIATKLGVDRHRVAAIRKRLGLPPSTFSEHRRNRVRQATQRQLTEAGLSTLADIRSQQFGQWKRELGWPVELSVPAVQAAELFYRLGPMTRVQLCKAMGVPNNHKAAPKTTRPGGTVMAELIRAGLLMKLPRAHRVTGKGKGRSQDVYLLEPGVKPHGREAESHAQAG